jgi:hypothetical protein
MCPEEKDALTWGAQGNAGESEATCPPSLSQPRVLLEDDSAAGTWTTLLGLGEEEETDGS